MVLIPVVDSTSVGDEVVCGDVVDAAAAAAAAASRDAVGGGGRLATLAAIESDVFEVGTEVEDVTLLLLCCSSISLVR